jgi:AraC-like DNA-binding protein
MEQHPAPNPPIPATRHARARWTPARQRLFLAALLEYGSVGRAAKAAGMSRSSAHRLRARLAGTQFDAVWANALALHAARLADPFAGQAARPPVPRPTR